MSQWHSYPKYHPKQEGDYLVASWCEKLGKRSRVIMINHYTPPLGFDFDRLMHDRNSPERIYAWLDIPPAPNLPNKEP